MVDPEPFVVIDEDFRRRAEGGFYDTFYAHVSNEFLEWRARGAVAKCGNILALAGDLRPETVLEVGAGTCSVIAGLSQLNFSRKFYALETSPSAVEYIRSHVRFPGFAGVYLADSADTGLPGDRFDLGILSHVLEHVPNPAAILREALRICRHVVLEVPLEDSLLGSIDWLLREHILGSERTNNPSGHVNFFNVRRVRDLVGLSGGTRIRERAYRPSLDVVTRGSGRADLRLEIRHRLSNLLAAATGPRVVLTFYGALVRRT